MISEEYRKVLRQTHDENAGWGKGGTKFFHTVNCNIDCSDRVIVDYGCGKGDLVEALREANPDKKIIGYDPGVPQYAGPIGEREVDFLVCTDVLEHIEPGLLDDTLARMRRMSNKAYFVVGTVPAVKILPDGRNAHLIVEDHNWWLEKLLKYYGEVRVYREARTTSEFMCYGDT